MHGLPRALSEQSALSYLDGRCALQAPGKSMCLTVHSPAGGVSIPSQSESVKAAAAELAHAPVDCAQQSGLTYRAAAAAKGRQDRQRILRQWVQLT